MPVTEIKNRTSFGEIQALTTTFIACLTRFRLTWYPFKIPIESPQTHGDSSQSPYPSHSNTHGNPRGNSHTHGSPDNKVQHYRADYDILIVFQFPTAFYTFWWSRSRRIEMASHFKSCPNIPSASRMSGNAHRMHLDCCQNLIPYEKNAAGMPFKCRRKLSIAARTCLECSRNVPSCSRVTDDVIQNNAESLRLFFEHRQKTFSVCSLHWGFAWSTSRHAVNEKRSYEVHHWLKVRSPRSSWRASSCCWRCPAPSESEDETMGHPIASHFPDGHSGCAWVFYSKLLHESVVMSMQPSPLLC